MDETFCLLFIFFAYIKRFKDSESNENAFRDHSHLSFLRKYQKQVPAGYNRCANVHIFDFQLIRLFRLFDFFNFFDFQKFITRKVLGLERSSLHQRV